MTDISRRAEGSGDRRFSLNLVRLVQTAIALGLLGLIFSTIGWRPVVSAFSDVVWWWVVAKFLLSVLGLFLLTIRWKVLLADQGIALPTVLLFERYWIARFVNSFLPGQTGGDLYRIFGPWGFRLNKTAVGSSVLFDRLTGIVGLLLLLSVIGLIQYDVARRLGVPLLPLSTAVGTVAVVLLMTTRWPLAWTQRLIAKRPATKTRSAAEALLGSIAVYLDRRATLLVSVAISITSFLVTAVSTYVGFLAIDVDVSLGDAVFISLLINVVRFIPISINGWGIREGAYVLMFTQVGVGGAEALSVALLGRVLGIVMSSVGAILYIAHRSTRIATTNETP